MTHNRVILRRRATIFKFMGTLAWNLSWAASTNFRWHWWWWRMLVTNLRCWWPIQDVGESMVTDLINWKNHQRKKVVNIMILPPTSQIGHHHKVTNITMSPTSLSPKFSSSHLFSVLSQFAANIKFRNGFNKNIQISFYCKAFKIFLKFKLLTLYLLVYNFNI